MNTTAITTPANPTTTQTRETPRRRLRRAFQAAALLASVLGVSLAGVSSANASVNIGGDIFTSTIDCGGSSMLVSTYTSLDSTTYAKVYVQSVKTGVWTQESAWHQVTSWSSFRVAGFTFKPGYYRVFMDYAQLMNNGTYKYGGEYLNSYTQHTGRTYTTHSPTCLMGN